MNVFEIKQPDDSNRQNELIEEVISTPLGSQGKDESTHKDENGYFTSSTLPDIDHDSNVTTTPTPDADSRWDGTDLQDVNMGVDYRQLYNDAADAGASQGILNRITQLRDTKLQILEATGQMATEWDGTKAYSISEPYMYNQTVVDQYKSGKLQSLPKATWEALAQSSTNPNPYTSGFKQSTYTAEMAKLAQDQKQTYRPQTLGLDSGGVNNTATYAPVTNQQNIWQQSIIDQYRKAGRSPYKPKKTPGSAQNQKEVDNYYTNQIMKLYAPYK